MQLNEEISVCPICGQQHRMVSLGAGERANCARCGTLLATESADGRQSAKAFALAAFCLGVPTLFLPIVTLSKFGDARSCFIFSGANVLWMQGAPLLALAVFVCGIAAPVSLLILLGALWAQSGNRVFVHQLRTFHRVAAWIQRWAMPEVQVLAVFVAFFKLGDVVNVSIEPGLWCYAAASISLIFAWRSHRFEALATPVESGAEKS